MSKFLMSLSQYKIMSPLDTYNPFHNWLPLPFLVFMLVKMSFSLNNFKDLYFNSKFLTILTVVSLEPPSITITSSIIL